ncbi:MAG: DUF2200 family protein [Lysobacter sp.]
MRYLDKLVDELAKGKPLEKILRKAYAIDCAVSAHAISASDPE